MSQPKAFVPTFFEILALVFVSLAMLLAINFNYFARNLYGATDYQTITQVISTSIRTRLQFLDGSHGGTIVVLLFWMGIGLVVYLTLTVLGRVAQQMKQNDSKNQEMVYPSLAARQQETRSFSQQRVLRSVAAVFLFMWLFLFLRYLLPQATLSFISGLQNWPTPWQSVLAVLGLAASLYLIVVLCRCIALRIRVFSSPL